MTQVVNQKCSHTHTHAHHIRTDTQTLTLTHMPRIIIFKIIIIYYYYYYWLLSSICQSKTLLKDTFIYSAWLHESNACHRWNSSVRPFAICHSFFFFFFIFLCLLSLTCRSSFSSPAHFVRLCAKIDNVHTYDAANDVVRCALCIISFYSVDIARHNVHNNLSKYWYLLHYNDIIEWNSAETRSHGTAVILISHS